MLVSSIEKIKKESGRMETMFLRDISYGMYIVSTQIQGKKVGCIVNTVTQITSKDPIISVSMHKENYTHQALKESKKFAVSILSKETGAKVIGKFGFTSSKDTDKFAQVEQVEIDGIPVVKEAICGYFIAEVIEMVETDTHTIFLARVLKGEKESEKEPMTYAYYHRVIKGKAPKNAPTYVEEIQESKEEEYVCEICGYVHKGTLPDGFICPICGAGSSVFKKLEA